RRTQMMMRGPVEIRRISYITIIGGELPLLSRARKQAECSYGRIADTLHQPNIPQPKTQALINLWWNPEKWQRQPASKLRWMLRPRGKTSSGLIARCTWRGGSTTGKFC